MGVKLGVLSWGRNIDRLMMSENKDGQGNKWRWWHNEELYDMHSSPNIIKVINSRLWLVGYVAHTGGGQVHTEFWWGDLKERDDSEGLGVRRADNIKMDLQVEWVGMNWIDLAQDKESRWALVNAIINILVA